MKSQHKIFYIFLGLLTVLAFIADAMYPGAGPFVMLGGTAITPTVGNVVTENNSFTGKGRKSVSQAYESTSIPLFAKGAALQYFCYAQLTGAMTINAATTIANLSQFDEVVFIFEADASQRVVTFGTGFVSSGTVTITAAKGATVRAIFDGTALRVYAREIYA